MATAVARDRRAPAPTMYLLLLGILAASVTYHAEVNPPGGFWQSDAAPDARHNYLAGDPVLHITYPRRYLAFFYCNAIACIASLVILLLLPSNVLSTQGITYCSLQVAMILDLFGLIGAYAAGSCRQVSESVYVSVLVVPVLLYVGIHVVAFMLEALPACAAWRDASREKMEQCAPARLKKMFELPADEHAEEEEAMERELEKRRELLLLLAILAASLTYKASMSPPGGFWQENSSGHVVGNPVLNDTYRRRYLAFFYCNATAFVASLAIIMLLVNRKLSARGIRSCALRVCVILDLVGLTGVFVAGSWRQVSDFMYFVPVFLYVGIRSSLYIQKLFHLPIDQHAEAGGEEDEEQEEEDEEQEEEQEEQEHEEEEEEREEQEHEEEDEEEQEEEQEEEDEEEEDEEQEEQEQDEEEQDEEQDEEQEVAARESKLEEDCTIDLMTAIGSSIFTCPGMSPPGCFWQENNSGHVVGNPVLNNNYRRRYLTFFYCNATAFVASLAIIMLLLVNRKVSVRGIRFYGVLVCMILELIGFMGIIAAGSCRKTWMVDLLVVAFAVVVCIATQVTLSISETVRGLVRRLLSKLEWPQLTLGADPFVEEEGSEDELQFRLAGGTNEEPLGGKISSSIRGGALTLILEVPVAAIRETPVKLLVVMMIATIVVGIWLWLFAPSARAQVRALQRRCIRDKGTSTFSHLVSALCHGLCKLIYTLCSGEWIWIIIVAIWIPSVKPDLKLKFRWPKIVAVLGVLGVGTMAATTTDTPTTATATGTSTTATTAMDRPSTATTTMDTPSTATSSTVTATRTTPTTTSGTRMGRRDQSLPEPRPRRNRRPNRRLMGGDWVN